jgi:hypothetical protein
MRNNKLRAADVNWENASKTERKPFATARHLVALVMTHGPKWPHIVAESASTLVFKLADSD